MSLSILNNIAALYAQNNINTTQSKLQSTLQQLSSGSRINSGADDPSGLSVADGLGANEAALTQSSVNASDGIGLLQTADGALSQVTSLLDQAVTLATEASNGTLTGGQVSSANQEYQNILTQIGNIGSTTNFNSNSVFSSSATNIVVTDGTSSGLNTYADTVGTLTTASVGTSAGSAVASNAITPVTTQSASAVSKVAGVYTLTPTVKTDTLGGQISFTVGSGSEIDVTVAPGTTTTALKTQLMADSAFTGAGLSASVTASTATARLFSTGSGTEPGTAKQLCISTSTRTSGAKLQSAICCTGSSTTTTKLWSTTSTCCSKPCTTSVPVATSSATTAKPIKLRLTGAITTCTTTTKQLWSTGSKPSATSVPVATSSATTAKLTKLRFTGTTCSTATK
jgi:flagellin